MKPNGINPDILDLIINIFSSGGSLKQKKPVIGKIDNGLQIGKQIKNDIVELKEDLNIL